MMRLPSETVDKSVCQDRDNGIDAYRKKGKARLHRRPAKQLLEIERGNELKAKE
jgi:hypothetical protein